jgi:hypothetical protein
MGLGRDLSDFVTGRRPELRNREKFFLLSPGYEGFSTGSWPANPHAEIARPVVDDESAFSRGSADQRLPRLRDAGDAQVEHGEERQITRVVCVWSHSPGGSGLIDAERRGWRCGAATRCSASAPCAADRCCRWA